jgi:regulator of sigma E protease
LKLGLERQGQTVTVDAKPEFVKDLGRPGLGVALIDTAIVKYPVHLALWQGLATTVSYTGLIVKGLYGLVRDLFVQHQLTSQVSGPVGIAVITGRIAQQGFWSVMQFTAMLSLNLAVINLLPIPALDGGRLAFIFVEWIRRRRVNVKFETQLHKIGFLLLLAIVLLVTIHDVRQYGGVIWQGLKHIVGL